MKSVNKIIRTYQCDKVYLATPLEITIMTVKQIRDKIFVEDKFRETIQEYINYEIRH